MMTYFNLDGSVTITDDEGNTMSKFDLSEPVRHTLYNAQSDQQEMTFDSDGELHPNCGKPSAWEFVPSVATLRVGAPPFCFGEVLRVTPEGEFIWADNAGEKIESDVFSGNESLRHILRALRECEKQQWQPIETAPKIGANLAWQEGKRPYVMVWLGADHPDADGAGWYEHWTFDPVEPTHWMPLPDAPTTEVKK